MDILSSLGISDAFDMKRADFSNMTDHPLFYIGDAIHKAGIDIDEDGTEAAAVTGMFLCSGCNMDPWSDTIVFKADRPFMFYIKDNWKGNILFMGKVVNPIS